MAITLESLGIDRLTAAERLSLVEQIWHSLEPGAPLQTRTPFR